MERGKEKGFSLRGAAEQKHRDQGNDGSETPVQNKPRINRLKRSPRTSSTQAHSQEPPKTVPDFKTPTRLPTHLKGRFRSSTNDESPNHDSECQHDIIWDPNSPATPCRNGRGRRRARNVKLVDISEIVNRIAPKSTRPEETDSSLLQWIGDSAVPCTPEVQGPRTKPRSARPNVVDDLLKLAKQFDFNMNQQDEAHLQIRQQNPVEAMDEDQELFNDESRSPPSSQDDSVAARALQGLEEVENIGDNSHTGDLALVQEMEDDLDLLFDGSTQQISGCLSQGWSGHSKTSQGTAAVNVNCTDGTHEDLAVCATNVPAFTTTHRYQSHAAGVDVASEAGIDNVSVATVTHNHNKQMCSADDFDDDWTNDGLLDDSLVLEMTQNPQLFTAPQHSSTQKQIITNEGSSLIKNKNGIYQHQKASYEVEDGSSQGLKQKLKSRQTFQLGQQCNFNGFGSGGPVRSSQQRLIPPSSQAPVVNMSNSDQRQCNVFKTGSQPQDPKRGVPTGIKSSLGSTSSSRLVTTPSTFWLDKSTKAMEEKQNQIPTEEHTLSDIADEDLDSICASDDIWDDGADDDDMFCEACNSVDVFRADSESVAKTTTKNNSIQSRTLVSGKNTIANMSPISSRAYVKPHPPNPWSDISNAAGKQNGFSTSTSLHSQKPVLQPSNALKYGSTPVGNTVDDSMDPSSSLCKASYKVTHIKNTSGAVSESHVITSKQFFNQSSALDEQQFRKPYSTFNSTAAVTKDFSAPVAVVGSRCSDAEIERKRQQAIERRRLRMTSSQSLRPPI
ncbi:ewing's tumor-associated antigen 1 [Hoplias malabaricus]|uniref:ewing's tumor-associated antigen 1 n=1 Tax=Hoplias malabaricus TaxID=27720 RepID=UPI0034637271